MFRCSSKKLGGFYKELSILIIESLYFSAKISISGHAGDEKLFACTELNPYGLKYANFYNLFFDLIFLFRPFSCRFVQNALRNRIGIKI